MSDCFKEAIIDTDFLNKITLAPNIDDGKDLFVRTMNELKVKPVVHYYLAEREMTVNNSIAKELIDTGYIKVYKKNDIVICEDDEELYERYFRKWYNYLNVSEPSLEKDVDVFTLKRAKHSLGEIHSVLMAYMLKLNIIYSDDSDAKTLINYSGLRDVGVYDLVDVYSYIGKKEKKDISLEEEQNIIRSENSTDSVRIKKRKKEKYTKVKNIWLGDT